MKITEAARELERAGWVMIRSHGVHKIYEDPITKERVALPSPGGDLEGPLRHRVRRAIERGRRKTA